MLRQRLVLLLVVALLVQEIRTQPAGHRRDSKSPKKLKNNPKPQNKELRNEELLVEENLGENLKPDERVSASRKRSVGGHGKRRENGIFRKARTEAASNMMGLGVFGDMRKFFDELRTNLATGEPKTDSSYEDISDETFSFLNPAGEGDDVPVFEALRTGPEGERRLSHLRRFVSHTEPLRQPSKYNPDLLWTGLGR